MTRRARRWATWPLLASLLALSAAEAQPAAQGDPSPPAPPPPTVSPAAADVSDLPSGVRLLPTGGLDVEAAALLFSGQEGGPIPIAIFAAPVAPVAGGTETLVVVDVDGAPLLAHQGEAPLYLEVCIYVLSKDQEVIASRLETVEIDLEQEGAVLDGGGVKLVRHLVLPAGEHSLRVLARSTATREVGLRTAPLNVPAVPAGGALLHGPFFAESVTVWLAISPPARAEWLPGVAAALPVLAIESPAQLQVVASAALAGAPFRVDLLREGAAPRALPTRTTARATLAEGLELVTLAVTLAGVEQGGARLQVQAADGAHALPPVHAALVAGAEAPPSWPALLAATAPSPGAARPAGRSTRGGARLGRQRERELRAGYRQALAQLADPAAPAEPGLGSFESQAIADGVHLEQLADLELDVVRDLARLDPLALWPVVAAYIESYPPRLAAPAGTTAASHARQMVHALAALHAASGAPRADEEAARMMLAFAAVVPSAAGHEVRARAIAAARERAPQDPLVLLAAAVEAERRADYPGAVAALEALRRVEPDNLEARLRLGVNLARLPVLTARRTARVELIAATAASDGDPSWWLPVAYQELGRLHLESGDLAAAEAALRSGLERLPAEEKLSLLLAFVLGRRGQAGAAQAVLAAVTPSATDRGYDAARNRYSQLPAGLQRAREQLLARGEERRAALAAALAASATEPRR